MEITKAAQWAAEFIRLDRVGSGTSVEEARAAFNAGDKATHQCVNTMIELWEAVSADSISEQVTGDEAHGWETRWVFNDGSRLNQSIGTDGQTAWQWGITDVAAA